MALSDREKRLLAEMEAALAVEDPSLGDVLTGSRAEKTTSKPGLGVGLLGLIFGIATLFAGLLSQVTLVGVAGFIVALAGILAAISALRTRIRAPRPSAKIAFGDRLNQRWERRQGE